LHSWACWRSPKVFPRTIFSIEDGNITKQNKDGKPKYLQPYRFRPTISPGQQAYVGVWYSGYYVDFYLEHITTGASQATNLPVDADGITDHSAERVGEWPQNYSPSDYHQTDFQNCQVSTNWETPIHNLTSFYYNQLGE